MMPSDANTLGGVELTKPVVTEVLESVQSIVLTVDELLAISVDLELPVLLDGGLGVSADEIDLAAARRSLGSKGLIVETSDGGIELLPWLTLMADVASDPVMVFSMRREEPETRFEWTLFVDDQLGVQQQVSEGGLVAWAPFKVEDTVEIIAAALKLDNVASLSVGSFSTTMGILKRADELLQTGADTSPLFGTGEAEVAYAESLKSPIGTSMLSIFDRGHEDPTMRDLIWAELGDSGYWMMQFAADEEPSYETQVLVTNCSGRELFEHLVGLLPVDFDLLPEFAVQAEPSPEP